MSWNLYLLTLLFFGRMSPTSANNFYKDRLKICMTLLIIVRMVLDKHAPTKDRVRRGTRLCPWYNGNVEEARALMRQCEHRWRTTKLEVHQQLIPATPVYVEAQNASTVCIAKAKSECHQDTLQQTWGRNTRYSCTRVHFLKYL